MRYTVALPTDQVSQADEFLTAAASTVTISTGRS